MSKKPSKRFAKKAQPAKRRKKPTILPHIEEVAKTADAAEGSHTCRMTWVDPAPVTGFLVKVEIRTDLLIALRTFFVSSQGDMTALLSRQAEDGFTVVGVTSYLPQTAYECLNDIRRERSACNDIAAGRR